MKRAGYGKVPNFQSIHMVDTKRCCLALADDIVMGLIEPRYSSSINEHPDVLQEIECAILKIKTKSLLTKFTCLRNYVLNPTL
jgi:hypothetical protein